jgi:hypothetical protein
MYSAGVEQAVEKRVEPKVLNTVGRIAGAGRHMVPLEQLMQHDSIEESAQAKPQQNTCGRRKTAMLRSRGRHPSSPLAALTSGQAMCSLPYLRVGYA